jgi:hypothetical protein
MGYEVYEENRVGGVCSSCYKPCLDSKWIRGRVGSQRTKSGGTACEERVEVYGHLEETRKGSCDEEVRGESYEETKLNDDDATGGVSLV